MARPGGGGGGPRSITDVDWFRSDPLFRTAAGGSQTTLMDQLSNMLFEQQQGYQNIDSARRDWTQQRERSSRDTGEDFASRGLLQSGLYQRGLQDMLKGYEEASGQIDRSEQNLAQQLGARNAMSREQFTQDALFDQNYNALASMYGLLGQRGVSAANQYQGALNQMRAQSAGRSNDNIINTLGW